jgi:hypothetical protein
MLAVVAIGSVAHVAMASVARPATTGDRVTVRLERTLRQSAHYPAPGSKAVFAGRVRAGRLGGGPIVATIRIAAHRSPTVFTFKGTSTAYYSRGTALASFGGTAKLKPDGRFAVTGHGRYTGGTARARGRYSFTGTAPPPPSPPTPTPAPCAVPAGSQTVAADADVVVIEDQPVFPIQAYHYCDFADPDRGFRLLVQNDDSQLLGGEATLSTVDGVAGPYVLYHSTAVVDSPACGGPQQTQGTTTVYALNSASGSTMTLTQGAGGVTSAQFSPPGVGAWILTHDQCPMLGVQRTETLESFSVATGTVTTLDTSDPTDTISSPPSLADLQLYQCAGTCSGNKVVVAWTHDGTWHYQQLS